MFSHKKLNIFIVSPLIFHHIVTNTELDSSAFLTRIGH